MNEIQDLTAEIAKYKIELDRLRLKLLEAQNASALEFSGDAPANLADSYRRAGLTQANVQREAEALRQAIGHAEIVLERKHERLAELEATQRQTDRLARVAEAKAEIESHISKIVKLGKQIEAEILTVKSIFDGANVDFRESQSLTPISNQIVDLVEFRGLVYVPTLAKEGDRFVVATRRIDLFAKERQQAQQIELERMLARSRNQAENAERTSQQRAEAQRAFEKQQLENQISDKEIHFKFLQRQKADADKIGLKIPGQLEIAIARAADELSQLQTKLQELENGKSVA